MWFMGKREGSWQQARVTMNLFFYDSITEYKDSLKNLDEMEQNHQYEEGKVSLVAQHNFVFW